MLGFEGKRVRKGKMGKEMSRGDEVERFGVG